MIKKRNLTKSQESPETGGGGRKRDRAETERKLMEAAIKVFSEHGYDAATTKLVAQTAGINEALINRYFHGKNGLLLAVIQEHVKEEHSQQLEYPPCATLKEEIAAYCRRQVSKSRIAERGHMLRIVLSRVAVDQELRAMLLKELPVRRGDPRFVERLERLRKMGQIPKHIDIEMIAHDVGGHVFANMIFGHLIFGISYEEVMEHLEHFIAIYTRGLLAT